MTARSSSLALMALFHPEKASPPGARSALSTWATRSKPHRLRRPRPQLRSRPRVHREAPRRTSGEKVTLTHLLGKIISRFSIAAPPRGVNGFVSRGASCCATRSTIFFQVAFFDDESAKTGTPRGPRPLRRQQEGQPRRREDPRSHTKGVRPRFAKELREKAEAIRAPRATPITVRGAPAWMVEASRARSSASPLRAGRLLHTIWASSLKRFGMPKDGYRVVQ